jgi:hypothetical protein
MTNSFSFARKLVLAILGSIVAVRALALLMAFSTWTEVLALSAIAGFLYVTAHRWVNWLPSLLLFGVLNSVIALITHHAPSNSHAPVSTVTATFLLAFYLGGSIGSYYYSSVRLSVLDRCSLLVYLACLVWPIVTAGNDLSALPPILVWSTVIGITAIFLPLATHHFGCNTQNRCHKS